MTGTIRVRFAPSPTGSLHLGNARTALFNYLYAQRHGGVFVLRIEDTDRERSTREFEEDIMENLRWLGLDWSEGPDRPGNLGPYRQTERQEEGIYQRYLKRLLEQGDAYPCYCTPEELAAEREEARKAGKPYRYSGRCRELTSEEQAKRKSEGRKAALRFRVAEEGEISFTDLIRGKITFALRDIGDFVIRRSDGTPLYNIANVIDDGLMKISHVIRGEEFISTTPTQIMLLRALGFPVPHFAHLPLLLSPSGGKLSKREAAVAVADYRSLGYLPEAMVNFLVLLGWSPPDEEDFLTLETLERVFDFDHIQKAGAIVDFDKLTHLNGRHIRAKSPEELSTLLSGFIPAPWEEDRARLVRAVSTVQDRLKTLIDASDLLRFYFEPPRTPPDWRESSQLPPADLDLHLRKVVEIVAEEPFDREALESRLHAYLSEYRLTPRDLFPPLRLLLTGQKESPGIPEVVWGLGKEETLLRLEKALG